MGTNTMVAAVGLVLGPVLGGALVAISWHWVFWFNVPLGLAGAAWGALVLRELAKPDEQRGYDLFGTVTFVVGLTGLVLGISKGGISGWSDPIVIGGLIAAAILLPVFVVIEHRGRAPMLDLTIFKNRLFAAATGAAFINGLSRFALMFVFVFYFQGAQGDDPIEAGIKLAPLALGMLFSSPLAGLWADRHGSRVLAALGMLVTAVALAAMTTLEVSTAYWEPALWLFLVGIGSGMFNSPEHLGDDGNGPGSPQGHRRRRADDAPEHRRGHLDRVRAGDRHRRGAQGRALQDLLRRGLWPHSRAARPLHPQHAHRAVGAGRDLAGRARGSRCCGHRTGTRTRRHSRRPRREHRRPRPAARAAHRRGRPHGRDHAAHDPLLRGDRPALRARPAASPASTAPTASRRSSACATRCA